MDELLNQIRNEVVIQKTITQGLVKKLDKAEDEINEIQEYINSTSKMTKHEKLSLVIGAIVNLFICAASIKYLFFN